MGKKFLDGIDFSSASIKDTSLSATFDNDNAWREDIASPVDYSSMSEAEFETAMDPRSTGTFHTQDSAVTAAGQTVLSGDKISRGLYDEGLYYHVYEEGGSTLLRVCKFDGTTSSVYVNAEIDLGITNPVTSLLTVIGDYIAVSTILEVGGSDFLTLNLVHKYTRAISHTQSFSTGAVDKMIDNWRCEPIVLDDNIVIYYKDITNDVVYRAELENVTANVGGSVSITETVMYSHSAVDMIFFAPIEGHTQHVLETSQINLTSNVISSISSLPTWQSGTSVTITGTNIYYSFDNRNSNIEFRLIENSDFSIAHSRSFDLDNNITDTPVDGFLTGVKYINNEIILMGLSIIVLDDDTTQDFATYVSHGTSILNTSDSSDTAIIYNAVDGFGIADYVRGDQFFGIYFALFSAGLYTSIDNIIESHLIFLYDSSARFYHKAALFNDNANPIYSNTALNRLTNSTFPNGNDPKTYLINFFTDVYLKIGTTIYLEVSNTAATVDNFVIEGVYSGGDIQAEATQIPGEEYTEISNSVGDRILAITDTGFELVDDSGDSTLR